MEQRKIGFGIIGAGVIAVKHAEAIQQAEHAQLVAVYDRKPERAADFAKQFGCRAFTDFAEFLADSAIEAVTIATPSGFHADVAIPAARAKKHILCEKPLEVTVEKATAIIDECHRAEVILSAVFQTRYSDNVTAIKKAYQEGRFGKVVLSSVQCRWFRDQQYYDSAAWRGTWAVDGGGVLMNQAIHTIDLLLYLNGDVTEVCAMTGRLTHDRIEVEDNAVAILRFANGSFGTVEGSTSCAPGFPRRLEISGTGGSVTLENDDLAVWKFVDERPEDEAIRKNRGVAGHTAANSAGMGTQTGFSSEGHRRQIEELAQGILQGVRDVPLSGVEGRRAVAVICAIYESARTGKPVRLCPAND